MPTSPHTPHHRPKHFTALYSAMLLLSLHWSVVLYINSSYLEQYLSGTTVGFLYTISSLLTIFFFLTMSTLLNRTGKHLLTLTLAIIECVTLVGLGLATSPLFLMPLFVIHLTIVPLILFNLDIYMEELIGDDEGGTGGKRGTLLTIMSLAIACAPLLAGYLVGDGEPRFSYAYFASALLMVPFIGIVLRYFRAFGETKYPTIAVVEGWKRFWIQRNLRGVFMAHFMLQFFFAWMVIYTPMYLSEQVGLPWTSIGQILFVGLMAYVLFEYFVGVIADRWTGEKEFMIIGYIILIVATAWFTFITSSSIGIWMVAMFLTRVGANFIEVTTESYFFKHTRSADTTVISFFRITRPLSYVLGALLGSLTLYLLPFNMLFIVLALLMLPGLAYAATIRDTK